MMNNQRTYRARAKNWNLGESSSGKEQLAVEFEIITPGAEMPSITAYLYFTDAAWERSVESLRLCGWAGTDISTLEGLDENEVELVIEDDTYDSKTRPKVRWINRVGGVALGAPLAGDKMKSFAAAMQQKIKSLGAVKPAQPKQAKPARSSAIEEPPPLTDSDLNF